MKSGQTLFIIDQVPYEGSPADGSGECRVSQASLAAAGLTYDSKEELYKRRYEFSAFDLEYGKKFSSGCQSPTGAGQGTRVSARNNLSYTVVKSQADELVGTLPYRVGALVGSDPRTAVLRFRQFGSSTFAS